MIIGGNPQPQPEPDPEPEPVPDVLLSAELKIHGWRAAEFERMGFDPDYADLLAGDRKIDLHDVRKMLESGCPPSTAVDLLI